MKKYFNFSAAILFLMLLLIPLVFTSAAVKPKLSAHPEQFARIAQDLDVPYNLYLAAKNNPFGIDIRNMKLISYTQAGSISIVQYQLQDAGTILTIYQESDLDSAETVTPTFTSNSNPFQYFDATIYNNANDSTLVGTRVDGGNDSARIIQMGTIDANVTPVRLDTLATNKITFLQRTLAISEAGKYVFPYWAFTFVGIDCSDASATVYLLNTKKIYNIR